MATEPLFLAQQRAEHHNFVPGFSTRPRIIYTPGSSGAQIIGINVASTDGAANKVQFGIARKLTLAADAGTGNFVDNGASADAITRTTGSFITDGWRVGDRLLVQGATTLANDFEVILTGVAALQLLLATGGGTVAAAEEFASATFLARLTRLWYVDVAAGAGTPDTNAVSGLNNTIAPMLDASPDRKIELGPNDLLVAAVTTALGTGETVDIAVFGGDY